MIEKLTYMKTIRKLQSGSRCYICRNPIHIETRTRNGYEVLLKNGALEKHHLCQKCKEKAERQRVIFKK